MALSINTNNSNRNNNSSTRFDESISPATFVDNFGPKFVLGESKNRKLLALTAQDEEGQLTTAYASEKLQKEFLKAKKARKVFTLPANTVIAPWTKDDGTDGWVMFMQGNFDLASFASKAVAQKI